MSCNTIFAHSDQLLPNIVSFLPAKDRLRCLTVNKNFYMANEAVSYEDKFLAFTNLTINDACLFKYLKSFSSIQSLTFVKCDKISLQFLGHLKNLYTLKHLHIQCCPVTDERLKIFTSSLPLFERLTVVCCDKISFLKLTELKRARPHLFIEKALEPEDANEPLVPIEIN